jgi:hypothetical protein
MWAVGYGVNHSQTALNGKRKMFLPSIRIGLNESHIRKCSSKQVQLPEAMFQKETNELFAQGYFLLFLFLFFSSFKFVFFYIFVFAVMQGTNRKNYKQKKKKKKKKKSMFCKTNKACFFFPLFCVYFFSLAKL